MAIMMECDECECIQSVGIIPNGLNGFPDPHRQCENCGSTGRFSAPGSRQKMDEEIQDLITLCEGMGV